MVKAFEIAGYGEKDVVERFGGMYRAFQYGAPPHGGMAAGVDRIVMLLCGTTNLREISLFPMNQQAVDLLMGAPSEVAIKQLRELHIRLNLPDKKGWVAHSPVEASIRNCASAISGSVFNSWTSCSAGTWRAASA
jgi:hypothetical protein